MDDKPVKNVNELVKEIQKKKVGQTVRLAIIRDGKPTTIEVTTTAMPEKAELAKEKEEEEKMGARVQDLTPQLSARYGISGIKHGVVVVGVEDGSLANEIGLREGDVILEINRKKIENTKDFEKAITDIDVEKGVIFLIHRKGSTFWHSYKK